MTMVDTRASQDACRLVLGGPFGSESSQKSFERLDRFVELGGVFVETAHSYLGGAAQEVIGEWIAHNPGVVRILTKVGHDPVTKAYIPLERSVVEAHTRASLRALHIEQADLLLYHTDDPSRSVSELAETLHGLVEAGLAKQVGASNWEPDRFAELAEELRAYGHTSVASYQYGLAVPNPDALRPGNLAADEAVSALLDELEAPLFVWSAQAGGYFSRTDEGGSARSSMFETADNRVKRTRARQLAADLGTDPGTIALAWTLRRPNTWAAIGSRTSEQLEGSFEALQVQLTESQAHWLATGVSA